MRARASERVIDRERERAREKAKTGMSGWVSPYKIP